MYAVFGVTRSFAREKAIKNAEWYDDCARRYRTREQYEAEIKRLEAHYFSTMRPIQLSHTYSGRQEAEKYLSLINRADARDLAIKKKAATGAYDEKDEPIAAWMPA